MQLQLIGISLFTAALILALFNQPLHRIHANKHRSARAASVGSAREYLDLITRLRAERARVKLSGERVAQPFFSVSGRILNINDDVVQVYKYVNANAALNQAKRVAPDGMTIGTAKPSWMAPPHFFRSGKLIVLYVGTDESILKVLQASLGGQFAGN